MTVFLLIVIYLSYVGLGIPDSLFGTAWPAIYQEMNLPISWANAITLVACAGTITSSLLSAKLINTFKIGIVTAVSTTITALALLGFAFSNNLFSLCLFSIPLGLGAGAVDCAQNNYVAKHYSARHMNFLHCFYGVGVMCSPYLMSLGLKNGNWREGYMLAFCLQALISIITIIAIPLWEKIHPEEKQLLDKRENNTNSLSLLKLAKNPVLLATWVMFIASCGIEAVCTQWGSTFFVTTKGITPELSAKITILYFAGLTCGRFFSGLFAKKITSWKLIFIGCALLFVAIILLTLPLSTVILPAVGLFLTGFGIGPIYPNLTYLTPINFNKELSQQIIGSQMAFSYVGILFAPILFGFLAEWLSTKFFPFYLALLFFIFVFAMIKIVKELKKQNKFDIQKLN